MADAEKRPPKKSELIEIRVDPLTKSDLQARARRDGKTVSEAVRDLIDGYLARATNRRKTGLRLGSGLLAALSTAALLTFGATRLAYAENTELELSGSFTQEDGEAIQRQAFETTLNLKDETVHALSLKQPDDQTGLTLFISLSGHGNSEKLLSITVKDGNGDDARIIAEPRLIIANDQPARIVMASGDHLEYEITAKPKTTNETR